MFRQESTKIFSDVYIIRNDKKKFVFRSLLLLMEKLKFMFPARWKVKISEHLGNTFYFSFSKQSFKGNYGVLWRSHLKVN